MRKAAVPVALLLLLLPSLLLGIAGATNAASSADAFEDGIVSWTRAVAADVPSSASLENSSFPLAADRTRRKDPLDGFKYYTGGWNISNRHYWASVAFTGAPLFIIAAAWFLGFGFGLLMLCCCYCCCRKRTYTYSRTAYALSLILLILFTCAAIVGCIVLYLGQGNFHTSTRNTLDYVVGQANLTIDNLRNISGDLNAAKAAGVDQIFLPANVRNRIDTINSKLNTSASDLSSRTSDNSRKIRDALNTVELCLIIVAAVMLLFVFLGFVFSILGLQFLVYILVIVGWILVAVTFVLCGVFVLFHNAVADSCVAMNDWVQHPHEHTALDDILPCVDATTANETLNQGKEVTYQLVNVVNQVITNVSNGNFPPRVGPPLYYNQSGPLVPAFCNPYLPDLSNGTCTTGEVSFGNASQVWKNYICNTADVSGSEICTTTGRLTQLLYGQMVGATSLSQGLYYYGPFLVQLEDCMFVRDTFASINANNCPGLERYSERICIGLAMVSAAAMLSLIFWVVYARERRHRKGNKEFLAASAAAAAASEGGRGQYDPQELKGVA